MIKATLKSTNNFRISHNLLSKWQSLLVVLLALPKTYNFFCVCTMIQREGNMPLRLEQSYPFIGIQKKKAFTNP